MSAVRDVISAYRPQNAILDVAIDKTKPYLQTFMGGESYYASLFFPDGFAEGSTEIYDNEGSFLIAAGGLATNAGLPARPRGGLSDLSDFLGFLGYHKRATSDSDEDVGISSPDCAFSYGCPHTPAEIGTLPPATDINQFVRIEGTGHQDQNICVARHFACGKNPRMPGVWSGFDGWQFTVLPSKPDPTFVAMLATWPPGGSGGFDLQVGLFEAQPAESVQRPR